ncbi:MAG: hypothetical protein P4L82_17255, partial [Ancalomicrobiaceae bacterium]|nr:hypothetical protein [Ancalomicrobiaceae bacterium]
CRPVSPKRAYRLGLDHLTGDELAGWSRTIELRKHGVGESVVCTLRYLTSADVPAMMELQQHVKEWLSNVDLFRPVSEERHRAYLANRGSAAGAFHDGKLVAYGASQYAVPPEENQGQAIGVDVDALGLVCQLEGTVVKPDFRGFQLARLLTEMRLVRAERHGYPIVVATISPFNGPSLGSFVPNGFLVKGLREGVGSLLRYYVSLDLRYDAVPLDDTVIEVATHELVVQRQLFATGWWGFQPQIGERQLSMRYARFRLGELASGAGHGEASSGRGGDVAAMVARREPEASYPRREDGLAMTGKA